MTEVWVLVSESEVGIAFGHGDFGNQTILANKDVYNHRSFFPAFLSESAANEYIAGLGPLRSCVAQRLEVLESATEKQE